MVIKTAVAIFFMVFNGNTALISDADGNARWSATIIDHDHDEQCTYLITHIDSIIPNVVIGDRIINTEPVISNRGRNLVVIKVEVLIGVPAEISRSIAYMKGDSVFATGYARGESLENCIGKIVCVDAKRIYVDFVPPDGFAGGGLFNRDGQLIGVCYGVRHFIRNGKLMDEGVYTRIIGINDRGKGVKIRCVRMTTTQCCETPQKGG
jgi:hypothetical protein